MATDLLLTSALVLLTAIGAAALLFVAAASKEVNACERAEEEAAPAVLVTPPSPKLQLQVVDRPPSAGPGLGSAARPSRHAVRPPPPPEDQGDDAMERPSILPEAPR